jgi:hypothetical protein
MSSLMIAALIAAALPTALTHSWLECTNHDNSQMRSWMQGNSTLSPPVIIDPEMPWYAYQCSGWPRNKANPGNWIDESTNYVWNIAAESWNGGDYHPADDHACPPNQRSPTYQANAPMASVAPGSSIRLRFGGNGHTRGYNVGGSPGTVAVYWKGAPEQEITDISEFTAANKLQEAGFSDDCFSYPADPNIKTPQQGLVDKGNWMVLNLPKNMAPGRHMMAWVWTYNGTNGQVAPQWSTCFDVMIQGAVAAPASAPMSSPSQASTSAPQSTPSTSISTGQGQATGTSRDGILIQTTSVSASAPLLPPATASSAPAQTTLVTPPPAKVTHSSSTKTFDGDQIVPITVSSTVTVTVHPTLTKQVLASAVITETVTAVVTPTSSIEARYNFRIWRQSAHARMFV